MEEGAKFFDENDSLVAKDLIIYLYPNQHEGSVFVKDFESNSHTKIRTGFTLPLWIVQNTIKILSRKRKQGDDSSQALEAETLRRKQEEKMIRLTDDIKVLRKVFENIKHDIQIIASRLKDDQTRA